MTNVPFPTLTATGFVAPSEAAILAGVQADLNAAFGGGLNPGLNTPQGQLASSLAAIIGDCFNQFLAYVSQVDPQYAQGRMQDAIGNIYFMTRISATSTTISGTCTGLAGTVIPAGVPVATDAAGVLYTCSGGTIGSGGSLPMVFSNQTPGPTAFTGPLTIYQTIPGWDAITGATQTALGQDVETQQAFEARRAASVAINAVGTLPAIRAAVLASGASLSPAQPPSSVYCVENPTNAAVTSGGLTLPPNSIYVAAAGGNAAAIAAAIWSKKDVGCNYAPSAIFTGSVSGTTLTSGAVSSGVIAIGQTLLTSGGQPYTNNGVPITITGGSGSAWTLSATPGTISSTTLWAATNVVVNDTSYSAPQPAYNVQFTVPIVIPVNIQVTLAAVSNPPSNALALLQASSGLATAFSGADGRAPVAQIAGTVYGSRFYSTIAGILPVGTTILSVLVGTGSPTANSQAMNINQIPALGTITLVLA